MQELIRKIIEAKASNRDEFLLLKRRLAKEAGSRILTNEEILSMYKADLRKGLISRSSELERLLRKRTVRTMSGIAPVAVLTKPFACPGTCAFCPTEKEVPKSYLSNEPAVMRAIRCDYDPYAQTRLRIGALEANGHEPTKIELIVIGGTWSVLPAKYQYWYIANCFKAANEVDGRVTDPIRQSTGIIELKKRLSSEQKRNESARHQIIGVTLETRPDYIDDKELVKMRELGCTRVELGVQAIDSEILRINKRGHGVEAIVSATAKLRQYGFKITYHLMPGLPGATTEKDFSSFEKLFSDSRFQPDQIKFYPTVVTRGSLLYRWWKQGKYQPYSDAELRDLIVRCKQIVPPYVRIIRLIRDIPGQSIVAGNKVTNLRQVLSQAGVKCRCIRCREVGEGKVSDLPVKMMAREYWADNGQEIFLSMESEDESILFGFCRLRLPHEFSAGNPLLRTIDQAAIIRELHVYGALVPIGGEKSVQHSGFGKQLVSWAEEIAAASGYRRIAVISGIGVREYYRKLGYILRSSYMMKNLNAD